MQPVSYLYGVIGVLLCLMEHSLSDLGMTFTRHPEPFAAPLGDEVYFECSLNLPAEKFVWRHRPLNTDRWGSFIPVSNNAVKTSRLVVYFDDKSKAGDYQCIAYYGSSGLASDPARLSLAVLENFVDEKVQEVQVSVGNTVAITCPVPYSCPQALVHFYKNNISIENFVLVGGTTMVLENVSVADSGEYHCLATNYITTQTYSSRSKTVLTVFDGEKARPPYFVKPPRTEYKVLHGKNVTLECFGAGNPVPRVTWSRISNHLPTKVRSTAAGLSIHNVQPSDKGQYHCSWGNKYGVKQEILFLHVHEPPRVMKSPRLSTVSEGGDLELSCSATGEPEPTIEWLINGEFLPKEHNRGSRLSISPVELKHAGIVQCVASNEHGSDSGYGMLRVTPKQHLGGKTESRVDYGNLGMGMRHREHTRIGGRRRPNDGKRKGNVVLVPPNQPNVTRLSDASVMVRWSVPENEGLSIVFFKVQYRELGPNINSKQGKWMTATTEIPSHVRSFEVTDLQPNHTYRFRIAAVYSNNDNKLSLNSAKFLLNHTSDFETNKMPVPLLTNTEALSPTEVLLVWHIEDSPAKIDGFYVNHRATTFAGEYIKTFVEGKQATNVTISHLDPDTAYEFKVQSFSVGAASDFSQIFKQKTLKIPAPSQGQQVIDEAPNKSKPAEISQTGSLYAIIGGAFGGVTVLAALAAVTIVYKRSRRKQNRASSQGQDKTLNNGRVANGGVTDSKINITPNPLAGLDAPEDSIPKNGQQSTMEMASFLNGQNNNSHNNGDPAVQVNATGEPSLPGAPSANEQPL